MVVDRFEEAKRLLASLPIRHREKISRNAIAQRIQLGDRWEKVRPDLEALRQSIRKERDESVAEAEARYKASHPEKAGPTSDYG
ncbi:MAG TPA: hypothetical protein VFE91_02555 [Nitrososphaerales archaeon]|nr:hypothetical protein [Nitrososphaerales archaeon]